MSDAFQNFNDAIQQYSDDAAAMFQQARATVRATQVPPARPDETAAQKSAREAAERTLKQAQGQLAAAFSQLSQAAAMRSEQEGREGYTAVVKLMTAAANTAALLCSRIDEVATDHPPSSTAYTLTTVMGELEALARLSPMSVWQKAPVLGGQP